MALRELLFDIGFKANANDVLKMDSAVDELKDNASSAIKDVEGLESATKELSNETAKSGGIIADNWKEISAGMAIAATGIEKLARGNAENEAGLKRLSHATGIQSDELRAMAIEMSNVTFPLEDVIGLMEVGRKQGLRSAEDLREYAEFWDLVGDATGLSSTTLAENSNALRSVGIALGEEHKALSAFGYITQETTMDVGDFMGMIQRSNPYIQDMGLSLDDTAALMGALEKQGITGRQAQALFNKSIQEAGGDMSALLQSLGISSAEFYNQSKAVEESSGVIQAYSDITGESFTVTQKIGSAISDLTFKYGEQIHTLSNLVPLISTITPLVKGLTVAKGLLAKVTITSVVAGFKAATATAWGFTTALLANPITWIILAIVALGVAIYALWKNWDSVTEWISGAMNKMREVVGSVVDWIKDKFAWLNPKEIGRNIIDGLIGGLLGGIQRVKDAVGKVTGAIGGGVKKFFGINSPSKLMMEYGVNINEGLSKGMDKSQPMVEKSTEQTSQAVTPTQNNQSSTFAPVLNITVNGGTRETVTALKQEWEKLMAQYNKRQSLGVV